METLWYCLLWWMLATFVVLDGFDFGAGMLHLVVARTNREREQVLRSIGPVWDGNEVWLVAAGGTMFFAFPALLASAFSGLYLPLMVVLWLLMARALGIELRHQLHDPMWTQFWDVVFALSSALLAIVFGAALGNLIRGFLFRPDGTFFAPFWTDFRVSGETGILDWFTILVSVNATVVLAYHGALWLGSRTDGAVRVRSQAIAAGVFPFVIALTLLSTVASFQVQPVLRRSVTERPWITVFLVCAASGLVCSRHQLARNPRRAFLGSVATVYGLVGSAVAGLYPWLLAGRTAGEGLSVQQAAAVESSLKTALWWWIPGIALACGYTACLYRSLPTVVSVDDVAAH